MKSTTSQSRGAALLAATITTLLASAQAHAQATTPSASASDQAANEITEVVVTARQRAEKLVDVPATVQAFTATEIKSAGIERPGDFIMLTPNVSQVQTVEVGDMQVNIRGINSGRDTESSVALVVDGVLLTNPNALNQELDGIQQIEVLKGPQGALYGRNALAGAIILTTRKPSEEFEATAKAGMGNNGLWTAGLSASGPITDTVSGTLRAYTRRESGAFFNSFTNCDNCENYFRETGANGRLVFTLGDNAEFDVKARYSKIVAGGVTFNASLALKDAANAGFGAAFWEDPNDHEFIYINAVYPDNQQTNKNISVKGTFDLDIGTLSASVSYNDVKNYFLSAGTSNAFGIYNANSVCQASYAAANGTVPVPPPFFYTPNIANSFLPPYPPITCGGYQYQQRDQKDGAIEVRLSSPGDQRLRWMAGIYAADIKRHLVVSYGGDLGTGQFQTGFVPSTGPNPTDLLYDDDFHSKVYAGFGNVAFDLTDNLELAAALRYDVEDRSVDNNVPKISPQTPGFGAFGVPVCPSGPANCTYYINPFYNQPQNAGLTSIPSRSKSYSQMQPKVSVNWKATDQWAFFASYGYGFRSGGFNSTGTTATLQQFFGNLALADGTPNLNSLADDFRKEVSKAAEAGFKARLFDNRLSINGAVYMTKSKDIQDFSFFAGPFGSLRVVTNIDKAELRGVEFDFRWRATDSLTLFGGYGYTDSEIKKYSVRPYTVGNKVAYVPEYTGNLGAELRMPVGGSGLNLVARVDEAFTGKTWFSPVQQQYLPNFFTAFGFGGGDFSKQFRKPYAVTNLHVALEGENWTVSLWGNNITDEKYLAEIIPAPEFGGSFIHDSTGRTYGINASYRFGGK